MGFPADNKRYRVESADFRSGIVLPLDANPADLHRQALGTEQCGGLFAGPGQDRVDDDPAAGLQPPAGNSKYLGEIPAAAADKDPVGIGQPRQNFRRPPAITSIFKERNVSLL